MTEITINPQHTYTRHTAEPEPQPILAQSPGERLRTPAKTLHMRALEAAKALRRADKPAAAEEVVEAQVQFTAEVAVMVHGLRKNPNAHSPNIIAAIEALEALL